MCRFESCRGYTTSKLYIDMNKRHEERNIESIKEEADKEYAWHNGVAAGIVYAYQKGSREESTRHSKKIEEIQKRCGELTGHKDDGGMWFAVCEHCGSSDGY